MTKEISAVIIDTDDKAASFLKSILFQLGVTHIEKTANYKEAVSYLTTKRSSYVFVEMDIPEANGLEILKAIREVNQKSNVILLADVIREEDVKTALSLGVNGFVQKPFNADQIKAAIKKTKKINKK